MASPQDDDKTVNVERPAAPAPKPAGAPAPEPVAAPDPDKVYRERLKADHGIEDPAEITTLRERARRADELEIERQSYQYQPPRQPQFQQQPRQQQFDVNQWQQYARVDPGGAYLQMAQMEAQRRQQEQVQQVAFMESRIQQAQAFSAAEAQAERYVRDEFPEAYNTSSKLHKEGQRVYSSMPVLQQMGDGFAQATKIAAANLGLLAKSKRQPSVSQAEVDDMAPERGTRRPAGESVDDAKPLTARQKKMAKDMGVTEKDYRTFQKARATGKNVKVG